MYQGELKDSDAPANGLYDFQFRLFNAATGNVQIGPMVCSDDLAVQEGRFATPLDFGSVYTGGRLYLEIAVRTDTGLGCGNPAGFVGWYLFILHWVGEVGASPVFHVRAVRGFCAGWGLRDDGDDCDQCHRPQWTELGVLPAADQPHGQPADGGAERVVYLGGNDDQRGELVLGQLLWKRLESGGAECREHLDGHSGNCARRHGGRHLGRVLWTGAEVQREGVDDGRGRRHEHDLYRWLGTSADGNGVLRATGRDHEHDGPGQHAGGGGHRAQRDHEQRVGL